MNNFRNISIILILMSIVFFTNCGVFKEKTIKRDIRGPECRRLRREKKIVTNKNLTYEQIKKKWTIEAEDESGVKDPTKLTRINFTLYSPELLAAYYKIYRAEKGEELTKDELRKTTFFKYVVVATEMKTYKEKMYLDLDLWHFYLIDDYGNKYEPDKIKSSPVKEVIYQDERGTCFYIKAILYFPKRNARTNNLVMNRKTKYLTVEAYGLLERIKAFWRFR
ncbi:MAG: hypothetical protein QMD92_06985 [bacterium]|nr:hypothetical protein [bacterium]